MRPRLSIIIPTLNEAACLRQAVASLGRRDDVEVIVADGGSTDGTLELAREIADCVVSGECGRASQLNEGAAAANGDVLLFLHADAQLGRGAVAAVRKELGRSSVVGGAFAVTFSSGPRLLRLISWGINLRSRWLRMPYGDQGLFVRADAFAKLGGFQPLEIMEDVDFVRRLRRLGELVLLQPALCPSDRRWRANGILRTTAVNLTAAGLYALAVSPRRIRRVYDALLVSGRQV